MPDKEGRPATDLLVDFFSAFIWSREAFLLFEQEKSLYNGFNRFDSVSLDSSTMSRVMHVNLFYITSARYEIRLLLVHKATRTLYSASCISNGTVRSRSIIFTH